MVFSSGIFLFLFLPIFLGIYYLTPTRSRNLIILIASYVFYAWWRVDFLLLFVFVTLWNYGIGKQIAHNFLHPSMLRKWLTLGVTGNLMVLGYFKYANFGVDTFNTVLSGLGFNPVTFTSVILPIGISFYIFQSISYLIDVSRRDVKPTENFIDFAAFIALFPQLIAGPVLRYKDVEAQFSNRIHSIDKFNEGANRFMLGFVKKVVIADSVAPIADAAFASPDPTMAEAWLGAIAYTIQLYFDFSGYSDMAIGLGLMIGFRFVENFNQPYISQSITEFWRRWHISLSSWLRDYLYIPLGGNRNGTFHTYKNLILTMVLGGLWHGANWTFVLWGTFHGVILAVERALGVNAGPKGVKFFPWLLTLFFVVIAWVMFRAENVSIAFRMYDGMFSPDNFGGLSSQFLNQISSMQIATLILGTLISLYFGFRQHYQIIPTGVLAMFEKITPISLYVLFVLAICKLMSQSYSPFLYFQF